MRDRGEEPIGVEREVPCWLASVQVLEPWTRQLTPDETSEVASITPVLRQMAGRLIEIASRLPEDDEGLVSALVIRAWASGVTATSAQLSELLHEAAEASGAATVEAASALVRARYADDPVRARRDGLDLLAGSLIAPDDQGEVRRDVSADRR